jgi:hypothetical protein
MIGDGHGDRWVDAWARKHLKQAIVVRALLAAWILFVTAFLCAKGYWWRLSRSPWKFAAAVLV